MPMADPTMPAALPRLTLAQLDVLRAVLTTRGVSDAARLLSVSQPAVSKLLRQVERSLGISLHQRDGNRVILTKEADLLRAEVERLFGTLDSIQRMAASFRQQSGQVVRVAAIATQATRLAVPAIKAFRDKFPDVIVKLEILANQPIVDAVASGGADFGLVHSIATAPDLRVEDIGEQRALCIAPAGHRFASMPTVGWADIAAESFLSYGANTTFGRWVRGAAMEAGADLNEAVQITASPALVEAVRSGLGVSVIEEAAISASAARELVVRELATPLSLRCRILRLPGRALSQPADFLLEEYKAVVRAGHWQVTAGQ